MRAARSTSPTRSSADGWCSGSAWAKRTPSPATCARRGMRSAPRRNSTAVRRLDRVERGRWRLPLPLGAGRRRLLLPGQTELPRDLLEGAAELGELLLPVRTVTVELLHLNQGGIQVRLAQVFARLREVGLDLERPLVVGESLRQLARLALREGEHVQDLGIVIAFLVRLLEHLHRLLEVAGIRKRQSLVVVLRGFVDLLFLLFGPLLRFLLAGPGGVSGDGAGDAEGEGSRRDRNACALHVIRLPMSRGLRFRGARARV